MEGDMYRQTTQVPLWPCATDWDFAHDAIKWKSSLIGKCTYCVCNVKAVLAAGMSEPVAAPALTGCFF